MLILYIYLFSLHNKTQIKPQEKTEISRIDFWEDLGGNGDLQRRVGQ